MPTTVTLYPGAEARVQRMEPVVRAAEKLAEKGRRYARHIAPVDTGRYAGLLGEDIHKGFKIRRLERHGRIVVRLYNDTRNPVNGYPYNLALEFGTKYMRRYRILGKTVDYIRTAA
jgi:hypothetical protein